MTNIVSNPITEEASVASTCGKRWAKNKLERIEIATDYARMMGTEPTYKQWEDCRVTWVSAHALENPTLTGNAHDSAWKDFTDLLSGLFQLIKPTSDNPVSQKKATERAKKTEELITKYETIPTTDLRTQLAKTFEGLSKNPENSDLKKKQQELTKVIKLKQTEENKAHGEELKELRAQVRDKVSKCTDIDKLTAVLEILDEYTDLSYMIEEE